MELIAPRRLVHQRRAEELAHPPLLRPVHAVDGLHHLLQPVHGAAPPLSLMHYLQAAHCTRCLLFPLHDLQPPYLPHHGWAADRSQCLEHHSRCSVVALHPPPLHPLPLHSLS